MASVKIKLRKDKVKADGTAHLVIQLIHNKKSTEISLGRRIPVENWDEDRQRVIGKLPNKAPLNAFIQAEQRRIDELILQKQALKEVFTVSDIVALSKGMNLKQMRISAYLDSYIEDNPEDLRYNTLRTYISTRAAINSYDPNLMFAELTPDRLGDFEQFLRKKLKNRVNTIHGRMKVLKKLSRIALQKGWMNQSPFNDFKLKLEKTNRNYLVKEELDRLEKVSPLSRIEELVLDCFRFSCYTGLRFSDICLLRNSNIIERPDGLRLSFRMAKTKEDLAFKLPSPACEILRKWLSPQQKSLMFSVLSGKKEGIELQKEISSQNAYFNKILKGLVSKAGIEKTVSFHVARHTFATMALTLGISMEILSKLLGHQDLKTTQIYGKIMDQSKDDAMSRFDNLSEQQISGLTHKKPYSARAATQNQARSPKIFDK